MAAPAEVTLKDLSGQWVMNKTLSDDTDAVLALQGVGWLTRKAINMAVVTLHTKQYVDETSTTHIDIEQTATGGVKGTTELRVLDWTDRTHEDHVFGTVTGKNRWSALQGITDAFLTEGWLDGEAEKAGPGGEPFVESLVRNEKAGWEVQQVWGFSTVEGKRYHTRRLVVTKGDKVLKVRLIYDWKGKA